MIPSELIKPLPVGQELDPFKIYFILPKKEYTKYRGWINRLNQDTSVTGGVFTFKPYARELMENVKEGKIVMQLIGDSNIMARTIHTDKKIVHVEHVYINLEGGNDKQKKREIRLFLLQLCRANLDEIRQELILKPEFIRKSPENNKKRHLLNDFKRFFSDLSKFYAKKTRSSSSRQSKLTKDTVSEPFSPSPSLYQSRSESDMPIRGCLGFQVMRAFPAYKPTKESIEFIENLELKRNPDGSYNIDSEALKDLLLHGKIMEPNEIKPDIKISVVDNLKHKIASKRVPSLNIELENLKFNINLKSKEGTVFYIATLLKRKFNSGLWRTEITGIFKNLPASKVTQANIVSLIKDEDKPAFEWLREIFSAIFGPTQFLEWFYMLYIHDWDGTTRRAVSNLKKHIRDSLYSKGFEDLNPYINFSKTKDNKQVKYNLDLDPANIAFTGSLSSLPSATEKYINQKKFSE